jgi:hypothetical protein
MIFKSSKVKMNNKKIARIYRTNEAIVEFMEDLQREFENVEIHTSTLLCCALNSNSIMKCKDVK